MIEGDMPVYLAVPLCLLIGIAIGAWQGFWIAYMRIPAFVVTLAGQLTFYGLTMMILQGLTINNFPKAFSTMFNSYIPDYFGMAGFNLTTMLIGVAVAIVFILIQITGRAARIKKGYPVESLVAMWVKTGIISVVLLWLFYSMAAAQGLPTVLFTVAIVLLLYLFITSRTVIGRHLYAMSMGVIKNGMSIMSLGQDIQQIVLGLMLLSAVVIDIVSKSTGASSCPSSARSMPGGRRKRRPHQSKPECR